MNWSAIIFCSMKAQYEVNGIVNKRLYFYFVLCYSPWLHYRQSKCFICGIGKEYFDKVPHGFEKHVVNEHNFANYMQVSFIMLSPHWSIFISH